jgi:hypothetical protein
LHCLAQVNGEVIRYSKSSANAEGDGEAAPARPRGDLPLESMRRHGSPDSLRSTLRALPTPARSAAAASRHGISMGWAGRTDATFARFVFHATPRPADATNAPDVRWT